MRSAITVVIPTRGMVPLLKVCLRHLHQALTADGGHVDDRVVVVDNASPEPVRADDLTSALPLTLMRFDRHHAFAACCNAGMERVPNGLFLMLNNDVLLDPRAVTAMVQVMQEHPRAGMVGSRLVFPSGLIQHAGLRFGGGDQWLYHEYRTLASEAVPRITRDYQAVTGACLLLRQEVIEETSGFDASYPFYFEDIDLCFRARALGWEVWCSHEVDSIHFESMTKRPTEDYAVSEALFLQRWKGRWLLDG